MDKFWDHLKDGSILLMVAISVIVLASLGVLGMWLAKMAMNQPIPEALSEWLRTLLGVWLGALGSLGAVGWAQAKSKQD